MKASFWDILSIIFLLGVVILTAIVFLLFQNPYLPFNPFPPERALEPIILPTATAAPLRLPPTWTYTPQPTLKFAATLRPSSTPQATTTPFTLPTLTPIRLTTMPTNEHIPLVGKCKVVSQSPADGTSFKAGAQFKADWVLQNTSDSTWARDSVDIKFMSGEHLHLTNNVLDMPQSVFAGDTFDLGITMQAPAATGYHITYWELIAGDTTLCSFYVEIFSEN
jgi:hypothetical protein